MKLGESLRKLNQSMWNNMYNHQWDSVESKISSMSWYITDELLWDGVDKSIFTVVIIEKEYANR
jgi:hypothetical protein